MSDIKNEINDRDDTPLEEENELLIVETSAIIDAVRIYINMPLDGEGEL